MLHFFKLSLHIRNKGKLISCSVEVMVFSVYLEVGISLKVVGQKSHTALKCHHHRALGEKLYFLIGKTAVTDSRTFRGMPVSALEEAQKLVEKLRNFITENYYKCTDEILFGLGLMYVFDERFTKNIDNAGGTGTAEFVSKAIAIHCGK